MPDFHYKARRRNGTQLTGSIEAPTINTAETILRDRDLIVVSLKERWHGTSRDRFLQLTNRVRNKDIVVFSRQLAVLISATVPIVRALRILSEQTESAVLKSIIIDVTNEVDGGSRLSQALQRHLKTFDDFFVYMIRAGETTGRLDEVLNYLADQKEQDYALVSKIISSMIYPAFILLALFAVFVFMMIRVVPNLLDIVQQTGADLPLFTRILVAVSSAGQRYWWVALLVAFGAAAGYYGWRTTPTGKRTTDRLKLSIPVLGQIFRHIYLARISRSLANLLASGVPVNQAIHISSQVVGNHQYAWILRNAEQQVESGHQLSRALTDNPFIPPMFTQMMEVGEETGQVDKILLRLSDFYVNEVNALTNALVSLIEPVVIILLGAGALILVAGILTPIYSVTAQF